MNTPTPASPSHPHPLAMDMSLERIAGRGVLADRPLDKSYFYLAGGLFNCEQLTGNMFMAAEIRRASAGALIADLPQFKESNTDANARNPEVIRAKDLVGVFLADALVLMFEGPMLDEGMIVEHDFAKALGIPTVKVRTDFRNAGDQTGPAGEPWNLMLADFPGNEKVIGMSMDQLGRSLDGPLEDSINALVEQLYAPNAQKVVAAVNEVLRPERAVFQGDRAFIRRFTQQLIHNFDGSGALRRLMPDDFIDAVLARKAAKGLIKFTDA